MTQFIEGEYLIGDEDGFIYRVVLEDQELACQMMAAPDRSQCTACPTVLLQEALKEFDLRQFTYKDLKPGDHFAYNCGSWECFGDEAGKLVARSTDQPIKSSSAWPVHHFKAHAIRVMGLGAAPGLKIADREKPTVITSPAHVITASSAEVVNIQQHFAPKNMTIIERIDALKTKLDERSALDDEIMADVALIREMANV